MESPRATTNGTAPTNGRAHRTAWPETEGLALARVEVLHARALELELGQQLLLAALAQGLDQLEVGVEVVLDRRLAAAGHEQDALDAGLRQLLDDVLHDRPAADGQHLLGLGLGGGQEARAEPGHGHDGDGDVEHWPNIIVGAIMVVRPWRPRCATSFLALVLVISVRRRRSGPRRPGRDAWCGTSRDGGARRRLGARGGARPPRPSRAEASRAPPPPRPSTSGEIAVLADEGDLALLRNPMDLAGAALRFTPCRRRVFGRRASACPWSRTRARASPWPTTTPRASRCSFAFPFYGQTYSAAFVNSDGNVTFGAEGRRLHQPQRRAARERSAARRAPARRPRTRSGRHHLRAGPARPRDRHLARGAAVREDGQEHVPGHAVGGRARRLRLRRRAEHRHRRGRDRRRPRRRPGRSHRRGLRERGAR